LSIREIFPPQEVNTPVRGQLWSIRQTIGVDEPTVCLVATRSVFLGLGRVNYYAVAIPLGADIAPDLHVITVSRSIIRVLTGLHIKFNNREWEVRFEWEAPLSFIGLGRTHILVHPTTRKIVENMIFEVFEPPIPLPYDTITGYLLGIQPREEVKEPMFFSFPSMPGPFYFIAIPNDAELQAVGYGIGWLTTMILIFVKRGKRTWWVTISLMKFPLPQLKLKSTLESALASTLQSIATIKAVQ